MSSVSVKKILNPSASCFLFVYFVDLLCTICVYFKPVVDLTYLNEQVCGQLILCTSVYWLLAYLTVKVKNRVRS